MTDEQIVQALECCSATEISCKECPYREILTTCTTLVKKDALDLIRRQQTELKSEIAKKEIAAEVIKRQQAEIEEKFETIGQQGRYIKGLKEENEKIKTKIYKMAIDKALAEKARTEAIKEFADKLKQNLSFGKYITAEQIDNLVKEMGCGE